MTVLDAHVVVRRDGFVLDARLSIDAAQRVALVGENGAGKTTLLRVLAGLDGGDVVRVACDGVDVTGVPPERRGWGLVFQRPALFPQMRVDDNVAFGLVARGLPHADARRRAHALLGSVHLGALGPRRAQSLSGGEAQVVALLRAMAPTPPVLLLDEPLAALDVERRSEARALVRQALAGFAGVVVVVTHALDDVLGLTSRLIALSAGQVVQDGPVAQVLQKPATRFLASLVGTTLVRGHVVADRFVAGALSFRVDGPADADTAALPWSRVHRTDSGARGHVLRVEPGRLLVDVGAPVWVTVAADKLAAEGSDVGVAVDDHVRIVAWKS